MFCKNCGAAMDPRAAVCLSCGVKAGVGNNYCSNCGATHDPNAVVCLKCGCQVKGANTSDTFIGAIKTCFNKYATIEGRASRSEYWYWFLFNFLLTFIAWIPVLGWLISLAVLVPSFTVAVRRLHDTGRSGWSLLFGLIPFVGWIILIVFYVQKGDDGANKYGLNPNV
jgi:uncharacterized membrane protein YhaH (DUF805 family)